MVDWTEVICVHMRLNLFRLEPGVERNSLLVRNGPRACFEADLYKDCDLQRIDSFLTKYC